MSLSRDERAAMRVHWTQALLVARSLGNPTFDAARVLEMLDDDDEHRRQRRADLARIERLEHERETLRDEVRRLERRLALITEDATR